MSFFSKVSFSPSEIKNEFGRGYGAPRKKFGQNFFINREVLEKITDSLPVKNVKHCLEIGPGFGALTYFLWQKWQESLLELILVEKDPLLAKALIAKEALASETEQKRIKIFNEDILDAGDSFNSHLALWQKQNSTRQRDKYIPGDAVCAGSLPYYISTPILEWFIEKPFFGWGLFILQKDLVEKITSKPNSRLAHWIHLHGSVSFIRQINPGCFFPSPGVSSSAFFFMRDYSKLISFLELRGKEKSLDGLIIDVEKVLKMIFWAKRKMVSSSLQKNPHFPITQKDAELLLEKTGIRKNKRPEELTQTEILSLAYYM